MTKEQIIIMFKPDVLDFIRNCGTLIFFNNKKWFSISQWFEEKGNKVLPINFDDLPIEVKKITPMWEYAKQEIIDFENWKRRQGILFMQRNFTTPPEELYSLYQQSKQK